MLTTLIKTQRAQFAVLAQSWLESGAVAFEVWENETMLARWPTSVCPDEPYLMAQIWGNDDILGELRIYGVVGQAHETRLTSDAALIAQLHQLEGELRSMTADLVASQDQLVALYQLSQSLRSHVNIPQTLQRVVAETVRLARVKAGFAVMILPSGEPHIVQSPPNSIDEAFIWQIFWQAQASEQDVMLGNESNQSELPPGVSNLFFTPIQVRNALNAGIGLFNKIGASFTAPDVKLIHAIAQQSGAHIENVLLYQESVEQAKLQIEVELAQRVQLQLLPQQLPNIPGLDIYAHSRPASQVGGDFYDFVHPPNRPFIFTVGDVTGKGLSAALLMTMTRTAIHSKASFMPNPTPEIVMRNSNEDLYEDFTKVGMFATAFIGQYAPEKRQMLYANAGHSPVIYRPANRPAELLQADSTPIGVLNVSLCRNHIISMMPGDLLIIATDGFTDVRNQQEEMFGYDRLLDLVNRQAHGSAREIATRLFDTISQFGSGHLQDDDQTLVIIKGV
ncbi:PP2C family protein-serine/threonine phosphatase [Chloroflexia bacterium SDU3-3]|nr:PP2C family protein-serine/threonine phosphatase [Chloroflexia bacterium SDU3-3]